MKRIFLVDTENIGKNGFIGIDTMTIEDEVYVFHGAYNHGDELNKKIREFIVDCKGTVKEITMHSHLKNAMDFQICATIGYLLGREEEKAIYYIISKDKGYMAAVERLHQLVPTAEICITESFNNIKENAALRKSIDSILANYPRKVRAVTEEAMANTENLKDFHNYIQSKLKKNGDEIYRLTKELFAKVHNIEPVS